MNFEKFFKSPEGRFVRTYKVAPTELPYAFRLEDGSLYTSVHFDGEIFRHPKNKSEIDIAGFIEEMKAQFKTDTIRLSCCYPDAARALIPEIDGLEIIGTGNLEYRTVYNNKINQITVESC